MHDEMMETDEPAHNPYFSPTLEHLDRLGEEVPSDAVACRDCPLSIWYATAGYDLFCRCSAMHRLTWGEGEAPIQFCDAREQAVAKLIAELVSQRP
jgi:hypothetical protein